MENRDRNFRSLMLLGALVSVALLGGLAALAVIISLVLIFFFHELGHYLVARRCGMQVTEFFIGFGPRIFSFQKGETEYGLKAIPAGAYVRITGMNNLETVDSDLEHRTYRAQSYPKRLALTLAGSTAHFLMALILLIIIFLAIGKPNPSFWEVGQVVEGSTADEIGVLKGDLIVSIAGIEIDDFDSFGEVIRSNAGETVSVWIDRNGEQLNRFAEIGEQVTIEGAAGIKGIEAGDQISSVDGIPTSSWNRFSELVDDETAHSVVVRKYGGGLENKEITVFELPKKEKAVRGFFGVGPELRYMNLNPIEATSSALDRFAEVSVLSVKGLINFFSPKGISGFVDSTFGQDSPENVASSSIPSGEDDERLLSIYGAARLGSSMLQESTHSYIWFLVLINVFVGIFNLVPLLPLDGGHAAIATYERIRSRGEKRYVADVSKLIPLTWAVITILVSIALIALYRDIVDLPNFG